MMYKYLEKKVLNYFIIMNFSILSRGFLLSQKKKNLKKVFTFLPSSYFYAILFYEIEIIPTSIKVSDSVWTRPP